MSRYIDAEHFDERVRLAGGMSEGELTDDFKDGVQATLMLLETEPTADVVEVVRCKDCKHQRKLFHADARRKDGGYFIYWCDLVDGYSHVCLDDEFCSDGERREYEQ